MGNPLQDQLLKAGLVTKKQVQKSNQEKARKRKQQPKNKQAVDQNRIKAQQAAEEKARRDRELNKKKEEQARQKAISIEINQLISSHRLERDEDCDIAYNFEHNNKVKHIYVNAEMKQKIASGKLGIARIEGGYELVPADTAEKIKQRNEKRIIIYSNNDEAADSDDPYSGYEIPDDLIW